MTVDSVEEVHLREVRKLQIRFAAGLVRLRVSWQCKDQSRNVWLQRLIAARRSSDISTLIDSFPILLEMAR